MQSADQGWSSRGGLGKGEREAPRAPPSAALGTDSAVLPDAVVVHGDALLEEPVAHRVHKRLRLGLRRLHGVCWRRRLRGRGLVR